MNESRLFKAARRTFRAEVTLVIVIVISFSWSAYALYRLFAGSSEPLLDLGIFSKPTNQDSLQAKHSNDTPSGHQIDYNQQAANLQFQAQNNLSEQLAIYKNQILKELLARQRRLLLGDSGALDNAANWNSQAARDALPGQATSESFGALNVDHRSIQAVQPIDVVQRKQWRRDNRKDANNIDYSLDGGGQPEQPRRLKKGTQVDRIPSSSNDYMQSERIPTLIQLTNAPSLMQLGKSKPSLGHDDSIAQGKTQMDESKSIESDSDLGERILPDEQLSEEHNLAINEQLIQPTTTESPPAIGEHDELETTTPEPSATESPDETTPIPSEEDAVEEDNSRGSDRWAVKAQAEAANDDGANDDDGSMDRVKQTVHAIDEEVDRMTQPSLGMVSQQDKSFDYRNTVHFDDSLPGAVQRDLEHDIKTKIPKMDDDNVDKKDRRQRRDDTLKEAADLQVADNGSKPPIDVSHANPVPGKVSKSTNQPRQAGERRKEEKRTDMIGKISAQLADRRSEFKGARRKADGEVTPNSDRRRDKRSVEANLIAQTLNSIDPAKRTNERHSRRSDDDAEEADEAGQESGSDNAAGDEGPKLAAASEQDVKPENRLSGSYQTITSSDPTLRELLAHKQLLDALQNSQLPAPMGETVSSKKALGSESNQSSKTPWRPDKAEIAQPRDHQPADTQYSVDHGLLLYPASDEEHEHKSMSKKSKNSSQKKDKKKMTVAMKKGGHKKKKHKAEEKKYLKEKKFKGAKKGKKMSKGKGGKGGKKGKKFYKDKGFKKKGFKNIYVKNEFGQKKSYFDEFRDKDFKKKWKNFDDKYKYAQMKKWQAKDIKGAKKMKNQGEKFKKYDKGKWKKKYHKQQESKSAKKKKKFDEF